MLHQGSAVCDNYIRNDIRNTDIALFLHMFQEIPLLNIYDLFNLIV